jgi:hypothetical protein
MTVKASDLAIRDKPWQKEDLDIRLAHTRRYVAEKALSSR